MATRYYILASHFSNTIEENSAAGSRQDPGPIWDRRRLHPQYSYPSFFPAWKSLTAGTVYVYQEVGQAETRLTPFVSVSQVVGQAETLITPQLMVSQVVGQVETRIGLIDHRQCPAPVFPRTEILPY